MSYWIRSTLVFLSFLLLTGCWNKFELTEWGFVQAVAIDINDSGRIELASHIYKPSGGAQTGSSKKEAAYFNILTEGVSIVDAIRDIPTQLGRKAQWSHMRTILIGEEVAKQKNVGELLDFFVRAQEPRDTVYIIITKGNAKKYLDIKPLIEHTVGQQLREIALNASRYSAKTSYINLYGLFMELKGEGHAAAVPYVYITESKPPSTMIAGIALLKNGKMLTNILQPKNAQSYLLLVNQYKGGIITIPCASQKNAIHESLVVDSAKSKLKTIVQGDSLRIKASISIVGTVGELYCTSLKTAAEQTEFGQKVAAEVKKNLLSTIELFQNNKIDIIGIGNQMYRKHPALWKKWRGTWGERFANSEFDIEVEVNVDSSGMIIGEPSSHGTD